MSSQPAFFAVEPGTPRFDEPARITTGEYGQQAASAGQMMVIASGVQAGEVVAMADPSADKNKKNGEKKSSAGAAMGGMGGGK